ncbi:MAG: type III pantothenate kinase [Candidatus Bipolaricaulota bacterium]
MFLALDVGNTNITIGCFRDGSLSHTWRISTRQGVTEDEFGLKILSLLETVGISKSDLDDAVVSSVVPYLNRTISSGLEKYLGIETEFLRPTDNGVVELEVDEPGAVGPDRIANIIAAMESYGGPGLIIDFGTATSFELYSATGSFLGGAISPEMETALEALVERAALLPEVELELPDDVVGKTTADNINSGFVLGFISMVEGVIGRFQEGFGDDFRVIATGGKGKIFYEEIDQIDYYDEDLVVTGLALWREETNR